MELRHAWAMVSVVMLRCGSTQNPSSTLIAPSSQETLSGHRKHSDGAARSVRYVNVPLLHDTRCPPTQKCPNVQGRQVLLFATSEVYVPPGHATSGILTPPEHVKPVVGHGALPVRRERGASSGVVYSPAHATCIGVEEPGGQ